MTEIAPVRRDRVARQSTATPSEDVRFSDRFSAFVVDLLVVGALQVLATIVLSRILQAGGLRSVGQCDPDAEFAEGVIVPMCESPSTAAWIIIALSFVAVTVGYHAITEGQYGATLGKRLTGLAVTSADAHASLIGLGRGVARAVVRQSFWWALVLVFATSLSSERSTALTLWFVVGLGLGLLSLASAVIDPDGRSLHDRVAGSKVRYVSDTRELSGKVSAYVIADHDYDEEE